MSKYSSRVNLLIRRTQVFVPTSAYITIAESCRQLLDEADKRPGLDNRVRKIRDLLDKAEKCGDQNVDAEIQRIRDHDKEAWFSYFLSFWELKSKRKCLGEWAPPEGAETILRLARQAQEDLELRKKKSVDLEVSK